MTNKTVNRNKVYNRLDREYRACDDLPTLYDKADEERAVNRLLRECGFKVRSYKLK